MGMRSRPVGRVDIRAGPPAPYSAQPRSTNQISCSCGLQDGYAGSHSAFPCSLASLTRIDHTLCERCALRAVMAAPGAAKRGDATFGVSAFCPTRRHVPAQASPTRIPGTALTGLTTSGGAIGVQPLVVNAVRHVCQSPTAMYGEQYVVWRLLNNPMRGSRKAYGELSLYATVRPLP